MADCKDNNVMPNEPQSITVQIDVPETTTTQKITGNIYVPFYYASISSFWIYFEVEASVLRRLLRGTGLSPFLYNRKGLVNLNFQNYTAHNGNSLAATNELEFNIIAYPKNRKNQVPKISHHCFMRGEDQTKLLGNYRVHVPCDNAFAVAAGKGLFGENKFVAKFSYNVPSLNLPDQKSWEYSIDDLKGANILSVSADFQTLVPQVANPAAIIDYSMLDGKLIGSRRNLFATVNHFPLNATSARKIKVKAGDSREGNMARDLSTVLGKSKVLAVQLIQTPPVIAESRAYYIE